MYDDSYARGGQPHVRGAGGGGGQGGGEGRAPTQRPEVSGQEPDFQKRKVPQTALRAKQTNKTLPSGKTSRGLRIHTI